MKTKDFFKINGVSSDEFTNVLVNLPPIPPLAERKYTEYDVGGDEDYTIPDDAFRDIKYTIEFSTVDIFGYDNTELYKLIAEAKTLEISRLPGYYYKIRKATMQAPTSKYDGEKVTYRINFVLAPFKYHTNNNSYILASSGEIFTVGGTRYSYPLIRYQSSGDTEIIVNGETLKISLPSALRWYIIDCQKKIVYDQATGELMINAVSGTYPVFTPGENQIVFNGTLYHIPNERSY